MLRKIILRSGSDYLTLPVTPESYEVSTGANIETVNIHEVGDVHLAGGRSLGRITLSCLLPRDESPMAIVAQLEQWAEDRSLVRFIVSGAGINRPVLVESVSYGEQDGTNDVYASIALADAPPLPAVETVTTGVVTRALEASAVGADRTYTAVYGDCLCYICRRFYGDGSYALATKLATYNGRADPNLLWVGEVLKIPDRSKLG